MSQLDEDEGLAGADALHSALASIPGVSVIVFDRESRIRALHGTALQRHGYVHEQMIGRRTEEVMPPEVWARLGPLYARALAGETVTIHQRSQDGEAFYESTFSPVRRNGRVVAGTMTSRDITAQARAEAELAEANAQFADANAQFQAILDHSPTAIFLRDREQRWVVTNAERAGSSARPPRSSPAARWPRRSRPTGSSAWAPTIARSWRAARLRLAGRRLLSLTVHDLAIVGARGGISVSAIVPPRLPSAVLPMNPHVSALVTAQSRHRASRGGAVVENGLKLRIGVGELRVRLRPRAPAP